MKKWGWGFGLWALVCTATGYCEVPKHRWTFEFKEPKHVHAMGLKKNPLVEIEAVDERFKKADVILPADFDLRNITPLSPILNQGSCGSCVYFSTTSNHADSWLLRGQNFGSLNQMSAEYLMTSRLDQGGKCNGSYFMATAPATQPGMPLSADCPYAMGRNGCASQVALHGGSQSAKLIDPSFKSIATALVQRYPVSNTIGANTNFQGYQGGIFNACANIGTNHETEIVGYSCETAKDASGNCVLDASGNLPRGVGYWIIRNSWGTSWGENGFYKIKMTDSRGNRCNNVAEEVGIIETGVTPPSPKPVPVVIDWALTLNILEAVGALAGVAALVLVLVKRK